MTPLFMPPPREVAARSLAWPGAFVVALSATLLLVLRGAVRAVIPTWLVALLAPLVALLLVSAAFHFVVTLGPFAKDETGSPRALLRRHGFWVVALAIVTALPLLGACSLVDPWETHYAEVAREMIERRDFISPWWANEGWFMSKPVLTFWLEALSMIALGVRTGPDQILAGGAHPEWAVRLPAFVLALLGAYLLYQGIARTAGRRAGLLAGVVLLTMPGYALLSHQAITDMPLVASIAASLGFLLRALATPDETHVGRFTLRAGRTGKWAVTVHAGHLLALALLLFVVPQLLVLLANHVHATPTGLRIGLDRLVAGSPHACGLPSQPACVSVAIAHPALQPSVQVMVWIPLLAWLVYELARETRASRVFATAAWLVAAFGAMAKGPAALVVPAAAVACVLAAQRAWRPLLRLQILPGLGVAALLIAPWYLAVFARHGRSFTDELVLHHMLGRTLEHLHDTNTGDDVGLAYFVKQLGYAAFPWSGVALVAMVANPLTEDRSRRGAVRSFLFGAALVSFALVSAMGTKFHHYGLIVLPAAAGLVGLHLDDRLAQRRTRGREIWTSVAALAAAAITLLVARDFAGSGAARFIQLMTYRYDRRWPDAEAFGTAVVIMGALAALACLISSFADIRKWGFRLLGASALCLTIILLDDYLLRVAPDGGQRAAFDAYYAARAGTEPLVAYQLNWKGENYYSGNNVAIFISSGAPLHAYLDQRRSSGSNTVFFVTERGRVGRLHSELGSVRSFAELTDAESSYEFALVRVRL